MSDPTSDPTDVQMIAGIKDIFPLLTAIPTNGITASEGTGAIMDSRAIKMAAPVYPVAEINSRAWTVIVSVKLMWRSIFGNYGGRATEVRSRPDWRALHACGL